MSENENTTTCAELLAVLEACGKDLQQENVTLRDQLAERDRELALAHSLLRDESQLACDLRSTQDEIIERCAKAVEEWPEAAKRLREHCANSTDTAVSGEDFGELRRELAEAREALAEMAEAVAVNSRPLADIRRDLDRLAALERVAEAAQKRRAMLHDCGFNLRTTREDDIDTELVIAVDALAALPKKEAEHD